MSWLTDNNIFINLPPEKILALTAYGEARGEGAEGMMAVLNVINNRAQDSSFFDMNIYNATGSPYHAVALKQKQFSIFNFGDPNRPMLVSLAENFDNALSTNASLNQAYQLSKMLTQRVLTDNTSGAVYYHAQSIKPSWASSFIPVGNIGRHIFYATASSLERAKTAVTEVLTAATEGVESSWWIVIIALGIGGALLLGGKRRKIT
mgnify:CR=1 FL=1